MSLQAIADIWLAYGVESLLRPMNDVPNHVQPLTESLENVEGEVDTDIVTETVCVLTQAEVVTAVSACLESDDVELRTVGVIMGMM